MISQIFSTVITWYMSHINYYTILLLMTIESSFIPFPSEIVIPPAAWKAAQGDMNIFLIILFGTIGCILGALFNYYLSLSLGRKIIYKLADTKLAHLMLINKEAVIKSENYFNKYGNISTFIGRMVPGIRQLISIPAGLAKMNIKNFVLFTAIGGTLWNIILAFLGYFFYSQKKLLERYYKEVSYTFLILGILFVMYLIIKGIISSKKKNQAANVDTKN